MTAAHTEVKKESWMKKMDSLFPYFCGFMVYLLYELSNARGLFWGDAGEFLAATNTLGIGHAYDGSSFDRPGNPFPGRKINLDILST